MTGIYIHVPFCLRKCPYCGFYSVKYDKSLCEMYTQAVCRNIYSYKGENISADTLYFGGGTPSLLTASQISEILDAAAAVFKIDNAEITIEANPSSVNFEKLKVYRSIGINRISFGVQSADDTQLEFLGRLHSFEAASEAVNDAFRAGFENISCDLMLGIAYQDELSLRKSVNALLSLPIKHISAYMLKIEQGTAFDSEEIYSLTADEELMCRLYLSLCKQLESSGFEHYEISNFALDGKRSRHNMKYWTLEPYIGIGPSAHSDFADKRYFTPNNLESFVRLEQAEKITAEDSPDRAEEYVMLSLRTSDGIDRKRLEQLSDADYADSVFARAAWLQKKFAGKGDLLKLESDKISLNNEGFLLSNSIITHLVSG